MPSRPAISFCIATHNRGPILIDCLNRLSNNGLPASSFEILVVDNASTDNTPALLAHHCPHVRLIPSPENAGPVNKNLAIRQSAGDFILLLDDDAYPQPGAVPQMLRHFADNPHLGAAVFDVTLPDGSREGSAYPDVFIGAGTGLRRAALESLPGGLESGPLPAHFFMQAEEYDLSFRLIDAGWSIQRFWDLPLMHLKSPGARIGHRTTRLDARNNLYLLARYVPAPLCDELAADWSARYERMAIVRDLVQPPHPELGTHLHCCLDGIAEGRRRWMDERQGGHQLLSEKSLERIFKFDAIRDRISRVLTHSGAKHLILADLGKNMLAYWKAAQSLGVPILAIGDNNLGGADQHYRDIPIRPWSSLTPQLTPDAAIVLTNLSRVHAPEKAASLRRSLGRPVIDLFSPQEPLVRRDQAIPRYAVV